MILQFRYPKLEVTYEKAFLTLDSHIWLGEVGGLSFLLFMLLRSSVFVTKAFLSRSDKYSYMNLGKEYDQETFAF